MNMIANDNRLRRQEIMLRLLDYETLSYQAFWINILSRVAACPMTPTSYFSKGWRQFVPLIIQVPCSIIA